ncbi:MAG: hypothetical protein ACM37W_25170 [Actinomycetota bacterium]
MKTLFETTFAVRPGFQTLSDSRKQEQETALLTQGNWEVVKARSH